MHNDVYLYVIKYIIMYYYNIYKFYKNVHKTKIITDNIVHNLLGYNVHNYYIIWHELWVSMYLYMPNTL